MAAPALVRTLRFFANQASPLLDLRTAARYVVRLPRFASQRHEYASRSRERLAWIDSYPALFDRDASAGSASGHYFHQDLWAARKVFASHATHHVDVGSRVDGFVAHCAVFTTIEYVDIRPLGASVPNVVTRVGSVLALPHATRSVASLSCLHVIEHVGLGRYGDPLDPEGSDKALRELERVVAPKGDFYLGVPIGRERVCFNAHRVLDPRKIVSKLATLDLVSFSAVDDRGAMVDDARPADFASADYACGLYHFRRER